MQLILQHIAHVEFLPDTKAQANQE